MSPKGCYKDVGSFTQFSAKTRSTGHGSKAVSSAAAGKADAWLSAKVWLAERHTVTLFMIPTFRFLKRGQWRQIFQSHGVSG